LQVKCIWIFNSELQKMIRYLLLIVIAFQSFCLKAQVLSGFRSSGLFDEQQLYLENSPPGTRILINAPMAGFEKENRVLLLFYALPNGNTIEQTFGKNLKEGDDWHFNIQHIGAQTRFLRQKIKDRTVVVVYLQAMKRSWSFWVANTPDSLNTLRTIVDDVKAKFAQWNPEVVLNSHSGGGRFIFSYIDAVEKIPVDLVRIAFLDSNYGYEDTISGPKLSAWLKSGKNKYLCTLAYNDGVVIYNGRQLVSPTGGTWYRSKMMVNYLSDSFRFRKKDQDTIIWYTALNRRIEIIFRNNPDSLIYHTTQVELNGFIHSMVSGTKDEKKGYTYFGRRAYSSFISDSVIIPIRSMNIPVRKPDQESGSVFMKRIADLPRSEREEEIYKAISSGNIPGFLRNTKTIKGEFADSSGITHKVIYEVMPDYLAVGSDSDFCRIPMNPHSAQKLASLFGASLITSKMSDHIYLMADLKLAPFNYVPVGNANELVSKFMDHNTQIEKQLEQVGGKHGQLVAGIKKDVILSKVIAGKPDRVVIYGWHKLDGKPIQPVYSGHVDWYVDYSHGIRLINNQVLIDGKAVLISDILKDPVLFKIFSDEDRPMEQAIYNKQ
jgi:hypothetical protein